MRRRPRSTDKRLRGFVKRNLALDALQAEAESLGLHALTLKDINREICAYRRERRKGLTHIQASVANPARPGRSVRLKFLVDSGAVYSVVPASVLKKLRVKPHSRRTFILAGGSEITRQIGDLLFRLNRRQGASPVIFGEEDDSLLLGSVSLEALGVILDPTKRELRPLSMVLARSIPGRN